MTERKPLDASAYGLMLLLTALWGFQQVAVKLIIADVSPVMQGAIRSGLAAVLLLAWARLRGIALFERDGTLWAGLAAGLLFAAEFVFIYAGLAHTNASRMSVFIYLTPPLTALGLHFLVRGERLGAIQWLGVLLAFAGIALAFMEGFRNTKGETLAGDLCGLVAALLWAATIIVMRTTKLATVTASKTLLYQLGMAAAILPAASVLLGEKGVVAVTPLVLASLAYQGVVVAFASFLAWFWLLRHYYATRLSVLSSLTPIFGVLLAALVLSEPLSGFFAGAAVLVAAGIALVNARAAPASR
jgi:drug/metabolite transporter (DMT)-like permease